MRRLLWWRPPCLLRSVIVNLRDEPATALRGVLWSSRGSWLTLKDCAALKASQPPAKMDGDVVVHRDQVLFLQVLP